MVDLRAKSLGRAAVAGPTAGPGWGWGERSAVAAAHSGARGAPPQADLRALGFGALATGESLLVDLRALSLGLSAAGVLQLADLRALSVGILAAAAALLLVDLRAVSLGLSPAGVPPLVDLRAISLGLSPPLADLRAVSLGVSAVAGASAGAMKGIRSALRTVDGSAAGPPKPPLADCALPRPCTSPGAADSGMAPAGAGSAAARLASKPPLVAFRALSSPPRCGVPAAACPT